MPDSRRHRISNSSNRNGLASNPTVCAQENNATGARKRLSKNDRTRAVMTLACCSPEILNANESLDCNCQWSRMPRSGQSASRKVFFLQKAPIRLIRRTRVPILADLQCSSDPVHPSSRNVLRSRVPTQPNKGRSRFKRRAVSTELWPLNFRSISCRSKISRLDKN